jgi:hypothetical protein
MPSLLAGAIRATVPTPNRGGGLSRPPAFISSRFRQRLSDVRERPRHPGNPDRGEGIQVHRRVPAAGPPTPLHQYARGGHDPLFLLCDAVPLRSSIDAARCRGRCTPRLSATVRTTMLLGCSSLPRLMPPRSVMAVEPVSNVRYPTYDSRRRLEQRPRAAGKVKDYKRASGAADPAWRAYAVTRWACLSARRGRKLVPAQSDRNIHIRSLKSRAAATEPSRAPCAKARGSRAAHTGRRCFPVALIGFEWF